MNTSNIYRETTLDKISEDDVTKTLRIAGWVENIRDHGGVSFIDLRDMYGVMQVVFRDTSLLDGITKEECISVEGVVQHRDEETYNPKIPTGTIELEVHKVTILGRVYKQLPFEIMTSKETREDVRLKYRYLDLRNQKVRDNMIFRSNVISFLRRKMTEMGFLEIQTPILCASSPEGARDYIVPSRKFKGKFYALPQAPQQYKQLLMVSGFDKYFQIAPCFRDEDARADRSPGEFYQLDFEMSFATQEDVFKVGEEVLTAAFEKFAPKGYEVTQAPYPIISYKQAMLEFGSDKPDLRNPLRIVDVTDFFQRCTFKPFHGKTVRAINVHAKLSKGQHEKLLKFAQSIGMGGLGYLEVLEDMSYKGPIDKFIPDDMKTEIKDIAGLTVGDTIFFIADREYMLELVDKIIPKSIRHKYDIFYNSMKQAFGGYFKAQFFIEIRIYVLILIGLFILRIDYSFLIALAIAFLDFLPFFGSGAVFWPWAIIKLLGGDYVRAIGFLIIWGVGQIVRQLIQPKIMGDSIGMEPIPTLFLLFIGYKLAGVGGMIIAIPVGILLQNMNEAGIFDTPKMCVKLLIANLNDYRKLTKEDMAVLQKEEQDKTEEKSAKL